MLKWVSGLNDKITIHATVLGLSSSQLAEFKSYCDALLIQLKAADAKRQEAKQAVNNKTKCIEEKGGALRAYIAHIKTNPKFTEAIGHDMDILPTGNGTERTNFKLVLSVEVLMGVMHLKFKRYNTDGIYLYMRKAGSTDWSMLAQSKKSPYKFAYQLADPLVPERLEFKAIAVKDDEKYGSFSDVVEVLYGG